MLESLTLKCSHITPAGRPPQPAGLDTQDMVPAAKMLQRLSRLERCTRLSELTVECEGAEGNVMALDAALLGLPAKPSLRKVRCCWEEGDRGPPSRQH